MNVTATSKRIIFVTGNKGGTGKTTFARGLLDVYQHLGINCRAYDTDRGGPQLHRHYAQTTLLNLAYDAQDWLKHLETNSSDVVLVDTAAGSGIWFEQLEQELNLIQVATELGYRITLVSVIARNKDSQNALQVLMDCAGDRVDYVAVKNLWFGDETKYGQFDSSGARAQLLRLNGREILLPKMLGEIYYSIDERDLGFRDATQEGSGIELVQRSHIKQWLATIETEIHKAGDYLGVIKESGKT
jgi:CobQ/CobB/MinD/ParA nucleotide binding domain